MISDLKFAIRQLIRNPGFTAIAVLSLALGIGATTAVFSILNGTLLQPTPYQAAERLVFVTPEKLDGTAFNQSASGAQVAAWREAESFRGVGPYHWTFDFLVQDDSSESVEGLQGTHELFSVLGIEPLLGRTFTAEEKEVKDSPVIVLGYHLWQRRFSGDPDIVGKVIRISRLPPLTVIGVMPPGVRFLRRGARPRNRTTTCIRLSTTGSQRHPTSRARRTAAGASSPGSHPAPLSRRRRPK